MPPNDTVELPIPKGRGGEALRWLESRGMVPRTPGIRSSDYGLVRTCPFLYFLQRRLGLVSAIRYSDALSKGSWFHKRLEFMGLPPEHVKTHMNDAIKARLDELTLTLAAMGMSDNAVTSFLERERMDALMAWAFYDAAARVQIPETDLRAGFENAVAPPSWRLLGSEIRLIVRSAETRKIPLVAQFDKLYYSPHDNSVHILDAKTSSEDALTRSLKCPWEFQCRHYLFILREALRQGVLAPLGLPIDAKLGSMIHLCIAKPDLKFGANDRDFTEYVHTFTRGKRKGQTEMRREYEGEPKFENYLKRCTDWYTCAGEFETLHLDRTHAPVVNISRTFPEAITGDMEDEYLLQLREVYKWASMTPEPNNFPRTDDGLMDYRRPSAYAPFYARPVHEWPDLMAQHSFLFSHRDEEFSENFQSAAT